MRQAMLKAVAFAMVISGLAGAAAAQSYPTRPVRVILPYPPGEAADIMARLIGPKMSEGLGQQVVVENRPGASGQTGLDLAARAAPDGYTIAVRSQTPTSRSKRPWR